ncbi:sodium/glucose cotransporter 5-like [Penaeus monodon]|uniref:sodium/glucose cotransporter 5-like n=1 Tax=Penaeus monodon TaxID=6687 RepID=UPI0018A70F6B|nr:sodium/glucose cotransporter 5-like [Penaeus monodon]
MSTATTVMPDAGGGAEEGSRIGWPDGLVIAAYFLFVFSVGLWSSYRNRSSNVSDYFLASRNMHWIPVGASLFASNIGSGHFIGLAGSGAASGIGVAGFEQSAIYILMLLGWLFVPVYMSSGVYTMPEFMKLRFGGRRIRVYLSFLALLLYIFTKISADLYAGALFIQLALNKNSSGWLYLAILILLAMAAVFCIAGGLSAVVWTDFVQTILMVVGAFILMVLSFKEVGGLSKLVEDYPYARATLQATDHNNNSCGEPSPYYLSLLHPIQPGLSDYPWTGMIFGLTINSIWYWCTDQVIVQRTLASKDMIHAKGGCILASYLKFLPLWLLVFPGMAARILYPERVACADPAECTRICGSAGGCTNIAYAELVLNLLPTGLAGLMLAVMMAALMSSLTSIFNSASTIFTMDVWVLIRPKIKCYRLPTKPTQAELLFVGRAFVLVLVGISVIWIPVIQNTGNSQLFHYIQAVSSFLAPPICAVYLLAMFWSRTNEPGAFWGLMIGLVIGMLRFIVEFSFTQPPCGSSDPDPRPAFVKLTVGNVHYLHFSCILWIITGLVTVGVSLLTEPIPEECLYRLTFWTRHDPRIRQPLEEEDDFDDDAPAKNGGPEATEHAENAANGSNGAPQQMEVEGYAENESKFQRIKKYLCRAIPEAEEESPKVVLTESQKAEDAAAFLKEPPFWRNFVNYNAVVCLALTTFVWGFFA